MSFGICSGNFRFFFRFFQVFRAPPGRKVHSPTHKPEMNQPSIHINTVLALFVTIALSTPACTEQVRSEKPKSSPEIIAIVTAGDLASAFEENDIRATQLYAGKRARINGVFARSEPLADGNVALIFKTSKETFRPVRCIFDAVAAASLNRLSDGEELSVRGTVVGFSESRYFVTVDNCVAESAED